MAFPEAHAIPSSSRKVGFRATTIASAPTPSPLPGQTAWELCDKIASRQDNEQIKDWNDSLNTLLIFAALYSAVLTAFIVESMKLLREDATETTRDILLAITRQLANNSAPAYTPEPFVAPAWAVRVNQCLFLSISCSLASAMGSVLALQWVSRYDHRLNPSSPEQRALQRHFRRLGARKWNLGGIIASLPAIIFVALLLFFVGMAEWLWHLDRGIAGILLAGLTASSLFFFTTMIINTFSVSAPFRTPVSRFLPWFIPYLVRKSHHVVDFLVHSIKHHGSEDSMRGSTHWKHSRSSPSKIDDNSPWTFHQSSVDREKKAVEDRDYLRLNCLLWLVRHTSVIPHQRTAFRVALEEILKCPIQQVRAITMEDAPWDAIFGLLVEPYADQTHPLSDHSSDAIREISIVVQSLAMLGSYSSLRGNLPRSVLSWLQGLAVDRSYDPFIPCYAAHAYWRLSARSLEGRVNKLTAEYSAKSVFLLWTQLPSPFTRIALHNFEDYQKHCVPRGAITGLVDTLSPSDPTQSITHDSPRSSEEWDGLLRISALGLSQDLPIRDGLEMWMEAVETISADPMARRRGQVAKLHRAVGRQVFVRFAQLIETEADLVYRHAIRFVQSPLWAQKPYSVEDYALEAFANNKLNIWDPKYRRGSAKLLSFILPIPAEHHGGLWGPWLVGVIIGLDNLLNSTEVIHKPSPQTLVTLCEGLIRNEIHHLLILSDEHLRVMRRLTHPISQLFASVVSRVCLIPLAAAPERRLLWEGDEAWRSAVRIWLQDWRFYPRSDAIQFVRELIIEEARLDKPFVQALQLFGTLTEMDGRPITSSLLHALYRPPVMTFLLQDPDPTRFMGPLTYASQYPWFNEEFEAAKGFEVYPLAPVKVPMSFDRGLALPKSVLSRTVTQDPLLKWLRCAYSCLLAVSGTSGAVKEEIQRWSERRLRILAGFYYAILEHVVKERGEEMPRDWRLEKLQASWDGDPLAYGFIKNLSEEEWLKLRNLLVEIITGLLRGFIAVNPTTLPQAERDPQGVCHFYASDSMI